MATPIRRAILAAIVMLAGWAAAPAQAQRDPSFNIVNRSGRTINEIYVSPSNEQTWGPDRLGAEVLPEGRTLAIRLQAGGSCANDILVVYAGGQREERRNVDTCRMTDVVVGAPGTAWGAPQPQQPQQPQAPAGGANPSFHLVNLSGKVIRELYVSPSRESTWGDDRLGADVLPSGANFAVRLPLGDCTYDIRVVYADNSTAERRNVNTCEVINITFP